ncbi:hypothetical protein CFP56_018737 [Quercus suber]|uniref:PB1-like domain-containing protein n=1 Tax=Quercus suber TaxID=58331 RepID=A0AAW0KI61_QUESU
MFGMDDFDFTITLYYWGKIRNNPYRYEGGETKIYEDNNSDEMSLVEIWNKAKIFGYGENDVFMYRVPTMPFAGGLKPLENDVDVMNMVKCIKGYNKVEVYMIMRMLLAMREMGEDGDNEGGNLDEGDKVDEVVSEEDSAHKVHFGCSESDDDDMFAQYISNGEIASKVNGLPDETLKDKQVKLKEGRKGKTIACGVSPSRVGGSGVDPSGVGQSEVGASGVGPSGIDARGVDPTWVDASGVNPSARGRPKKKRKKEPGELNNPYKMKRRIGHVKCSQCGIVGHNKRRCNPATQASKQLRVRLVIVREPNVTARSLENQEHGTSSSHVEPSNRIAPPPQTSKEAYVSQHSQKIPISNCKLGKEMSQHKVSQHPNVKEYNEVNQHLRLDPTKLQEIIVLECQ